MSYPVSACCFIRNNSVGFCLYESMASLLPLCREMVIMDLGSDDGTLETLADIANHNPKVKLVSGSFYNIDANVFATLANDLIAMCKYDNVLYWQADEIWHEDLLKLMEQRFERGEFDLSFWRIQYANNFQYVKWFPQLVHRVGYKGKDIKFNEEKENFEFNNDGMNTTRQWDAKICSDYGGEYNIQWGEMGQEGIKPYVNQMITDVSLIGGFRDNIPDRKRMHAPFWKETEVLIPYFDRVTKKQPLMSESEWMQTALADEDWTKEDSPYNLPAILRYHVGKTKYELSPELWEALRWERTKEFISSLLIRMKSLSDSYRYLIASEESG